MAGEDDAIGGDVGDVSQDLELLNKDANDAEEDNTEEEDNEKSEENDESDSDQEDSEEDGEELEEEEEKEDEEAEEEEEGEEDVEEEPEVEDPDRPGSEAGRLVARLEKSHKGLLKEFPELRRAIFRDQAYNQIFPTIDDAKEAVEKAEVMDEHEDRLMAGDASALLKVVGERSEQSLEALALNFLPTLGKMSPALTSRAVFPYVRGILATALNDAKSSGNKNLHHSIGHIANYLWGKFELPPPPDNRPDTRQDPKFLEAEKRARDAEIKLDNQFTERTARVSHGRLHSILEKGLVGETRLNPFERRQVRAEIFRRVTSALDGNAEYCKQMQGLFARAAREGYADGYVARIGDAFMAGARNLIPTIRAKVVAEVLKEKGMKKAGNDKENKKKKTIIEHPSTTQTKTGLGKGGKVDRSRNIDYNSTSDDDILAGNIRYRK